MDTINSIMKPVVAIVTALMFIYGYLISLLRISRKQPQSSQHIIPVSVNFHFTRCCNYQCGFCFHTAKTSHLTPLVEAKKGLFKLKNAGMKKLNFSGGEPFMEPKYLGELIRYCKCDLGIESVSIVSNGSLIKERFFVEFGDYLDILAVSVDSFDETTNVKIGRGRGSHLKHLEKVSKWCSEYNVRFKLNTVVNRYNLEEDMNDAIERLQPFRWKCFQVLLVDTENNGMDTLRDAGKFLITDQEYRYFCDRHNHQKCFVPEDNETMASSYLILDEYMRFLNKGGHYSESKSILVASVEEALRNVDYNEDMFYKRGGVYDWSKNCASDCDKNMEW